MARSWWPWAKSSPLVLSSTFIGLALARRQWLNWGSTEDERTRPLPGDDVLPSAPSVSTQAIGLPVTSEAVWPWLAQMGYAGRAGFYSYPWLEYVGGARDSRRLHGLPGPEVGDRLPYFTPAPLVVTQAQRPRILVLAQRSPISSRTRIDWTWSFTLVPMDGGGCRLIVRMRFDCHPRWLAPLAHGVLEAAHAVMGRRQLLGIADRVGRGNAPAGYAATTPF